MTDDQKQKQGFYTIGVISRMLDIHQQTLRIYEKRGLLKPARTEGNTRLYSEQNIEQIKRIQRLTSEFGVNLAGIEIILQMRERMVEMETEREKLEGAILELMEIVIGHHEQTRKNALIRSPFSTLVRAIRHHRPEPESEGGDDRGTVR